MELRSNVTAVEILPSWMIPVDIVKLALNTFTIIAASTFLCIIVVDKLYKTVPMILVRNSCVAELLLGFYLFIKDILTFYYDVSRIRSSSWLCLSTGFLAYASFGLQNYSYLLQAIYRYTLIVHPNRIFYQSMKFQIVLILILFICCFIYPIPLILTDQIKYLPDEAICQMPLGLSFMTIFNACFVYFIPMFGIMIVYVRTVKYIHGMRKRTIPANRLFHAKRQLMVVRRIVSLVSILLILGFPYAIFVFMSFFNRAPKYHFRMAFTFISVSLVLVMIAIFELTEPLKASIMKRIRIRQVHAIQPIS